MAVGGQFIDQCSVATSDHVETEISQGGRAASAVEPQLTGLLAGGASIDFVRLVPPIAIVVWSSTAEAFSGPAQFHLAKCGRSCCWHRVVNQSR